MEKKTKKTKKELSKKQRQSCNGGWWAGRYRPKPRVGTAVKKKGALEDAIADTQNLLNNLKELKKTLGKMGAN